MSSRDIAIRTSNLGKAYRLGVLSEQKHSGYDILGFNLPLQRLWPILLGDEQDITAADNVFWALRELDIEIRRGEVVGIIGRNGSRQEHAAETAGAHDRADRPASPM